MKFAVNDYVGHYRDPKLFIKEYFGEGLSNPFIFYPDMKNFYHIQVIDLRIQVDDKKPKRLNYSKNIQ